MKWTNEKIILQLLLFLTLASCGSTKIERISSNECNSQIKIIKYKEGFFRGKNEGKRVEKGNHFYIYFAGGYANDEVKAYINGQLLFHKKITTDESLGTTEKGFYYHYGNNKGPDILKVTKNGNNYCLEMALDRKFRQVFIHSNNNNWEVIYDNIYPLYE